MANLAQVARLFVGYYYEWLRAWALFGSLHMRDDGYLVDPASSHMLVSKTKPCMSKYKPNFYGETANGSLNQL
jgi:hypothetical protein